MRPDTLAALRHIQHSARFILERTENITYEEFVGDELLRLGVERSFEIIGEAASRIDRHDEATISRISNVRRIVGLRNVIVHGYDVIKYSRIWEAADVSEGYGSSGFQVTGIIFPTEGCWEISGQAGDEPLTFVTLVISPPETIASDRATPAR